MSENGPQGGGNNVGVYDGGGGQPKQKKKVSSGNLFANRNYTAEISGAGSCRIVASTEKKLAATEVFYMFISGGVGLDFLLMCFKWKVNRNELWEKHALRQFGVFRKND